MPGSSVFPLCLGRTADDPEAVCGGIKYPVQYLPDGEACVISFERTVHQYVLAKLMVRPERSPPDGSDYDWQVEAIDNKPVCSSQSPTPS
jgi:hypothetical protein